MKIHLVYHCDVCRQADFGILEVRADRTAFWIQPPRWQLVWSPQRFFFACSKACATLRLKHHEELDNLVSTC